MLGRDFFDCVQKHDELDWLGVHEDSSGEDEAFVCHNKIGINHAVAIKSILAHSWKDLEEVMLGKREAHLMTHLTRIVGYWSRTSNWNKSKLAELADRHKGSYSIPEPETTLGRSAPTTNVPRTKHPVAQLSTVTA